MIRRGNAADLETVARIQKVSPEAAQWDVREYLQYDFLVAECHGAIGGFAVWRQISEGERELLNLAVDPAFRRRGVARRLMAEVISGRNHTVWLEVRESNFRARKLYEKLAFEETGKRPGYYAHLSESAIVMKFHS